MNRCRFSGRAGLVLIGVTDSVAKKRRMYFQAREIKKKNMTKRMRFNAKDLTAELEVLVPFVVLKTNGRRASK